MWLGILLCLTGSALCSGLTLGFFSLSRIHLELLKKQHLPEAALILSLRENANFLLATLLWSNVAVNVLLTLLSDHQLSGILGFTFSLVGITLFGEILPQAYFARNALQAVNAASKFFNGFFTQLPNHPPSYWIGSWAKKGSHGLMNMNSRHSSKFMPRRRNQKLAL